MNFNYRLQPKHHLRARIRIVTLAIGASLALMLVGCATIPGSGKVEVGLTDLEQAEQFFQFTATGPVIDASQEDLVRGFVAAAVSSVDDYAVAREFLTTDYAAQWDPYFGVLVDEGARNYRSDGSAAGVLSLSATAKIDVAGQMLPVEPGPATDLRFEFERVNGQWRLSSAPSGIILDKSTFKSIWADNQLYFVGPGNVLVPQTRWFIARAAMPTEIVSALLEGPRERMRGSLHSGFPAGTALVSKSVPVVDGRARIDMTTELLEASPQALAEVRAQLTLSLQSVPGVNGFELMVEGTPLREASGGTEPRTVTEASLPAVLVDGELGTIAAGEFSPIEMYGDRIGELDPLAVSMSNDGARAAVLNEHGVTLLDAQGNQLADGRAHQLAPSIDLFRYLWTSTAAGQLQARGSDNVPAPITAPWLAGLDVAAVRLAPDGSRIAALVASEGGAQLLVGGVIRDERGAPLRATDEADTEMWITGKPVDFDWVGSSRLSVLSADGLVTKVTSGGPGRFSEAQGSISGGTHISGGGARAHLRLLNDEGELFAPQAAGWQRNDDNIQLLAKRG
ncbi:GerMN domain-containing protein [Leucobacter salsicius]|uniref:GerMN domain-containing protein n=1 Tax=Leucobacter salsicius TaxID=664638 RepID=UPI0003477718|nr:LpqB family beta-propeller domain-containing protein [Leucobacter salsicius]